MHGYSKPKLVFAEDCRAAFTSAISERMVEFVPGPVDHFGNTPADVAPSVSGRGTFWLPTGTGACGYNRPLITMHD